MLAGAGFDWLLLDTEHAPNELPMVYSQLPAAASGGTAHPVVRLPWNDAVMIKRFLDAGAQTLLLPIVETAEGQSAPWRRRAIHRGAYGVIPAVSRLPLRPREGLLRPRA